MARDHFIAPTAPTDDAVAVRLGAGSGIVHNLTQLEVGKFAKLAGESRYHLAAVGNEIEAVITAVEIAPQNGFTIGAVRTEGIMNVTFDGLQATPGTGVVAIGDYVVTGTPVAKGIASTVPSKVCKATAAATGIVFKWRIVSLGTAGTGAVGTTGVIQFVS
jgi:hypothetical protein